MLADGPPWLSPLGEGAAPATVTVPVMPAAACPGTVQVKVVPPAGIVTVPVAICPASAGSLVPSAKVRSWSEGAGVVERDGVDAGLRHVDRLRVEAEVEGVDA